ncbi:hypothetical protein A4G19_14555 [Pasteurellaceae bacterium Macca]|nr:hypothetical protein [Pasteurellaceae bacterium Macca]
MKNLFKIATLSAAFATAGFATAADNLGFADANFLLQNHPVVIDASHKFEKFMKESQAKFAAEDKALTKENEALVAERNKLESDAKKLGEEQKKVEASMKNKIAALEKEAPRLRSGDIKKRQDAINAEAKAFQNKVTAIQKREEAFKKKADAFQKKATAFQNKINQEQQAAGGVDPATLQKQAIEEVNAAIKEIAKAKGYTLVLQPGIALYAEDESKDITNAVLDALKAKHPEIKIEPAKSEKTADTKEAEKPAEKAADVAQPAAK